MLAMIEEITAVTSAMKRQKVTGNKYILQSDVNWSNLYLGRAALIHINIITWHNNLRSRDR